ncbi:MAG: prolyl oligopeptidase family serine peptidase [Candidatus Eisenbacteria bacterium]|nr:prolyl oligopeptidase family serine peptidase [Candidatus Eisenbacteria bacterium]
MQELNIRRYGPAAAARTSGPAGAGRRLLPAAASLLAAAFWLTGCAEQDGSREVEVPGPSAASGTVAFATPVPDIETFMQIGWNGDPSLSADGETLHFTSGLPGVNQVFRLLPEGWPYQLTVFPDGIDFFSASPGGAWMIVGASEGGNERSQLFLMDGQTGALKKLTDAPQARFLYPIWGRDRGTIYYSSNEANGRDFYVYRRTMPDGEPELIYQAAGYNIAMDTDSEERRLLMLEFRSSTDSDILMLDLETDGLRNLTEHEGDIYYGLGVFSADDESLLVVTNNNEDGLKRPAWLDPETGELNFFIRPDSPWELEDAGISEDRGTAAFVYNEDGYGNLVLYDLEHGAELPAPPVQGIVSSVSLSNGPKLAFGFTSPTRAPDVWTWDWDQGELNRATYSSYAGVDPGIFREPELIHYTSFDGLEVPAFLYLPPDGRDGPVPFIIDVHGGPEGQFRPYFNRHFNYLMQNGFGLLAPNVRGSTGYGKEYAMLDNYKNRMDSVRDIGAAARWLIDEGYTEPSRLGIKGASYGGFMTLAALANFPELFAAGLDEVGIANFETFLKNTAEYRRHLREAEYGPLDDPEFLREVSPITKVDSIRAALLVVHGENDPRVPVSEARQIARALQARGAPVDTLIFPDEGHGVSKRANRLILYRRMVDFFRKHLQQIPAES